MNELMRERHPSCPFGLLHGSKFVPGPTQFMRSLVPARSNARHAGAEAAEAGVDVGAAADNAVDDAVDGAEVEFGAEVDE